VVFEKGEKPSGLKKKTLMEHLCKKSNRNKCSNYKGISLVSVKSKLLSAMMLFGLEMF